jgi:hypothetical protein
MSKNMGVFIENEGAFLLRPAETFDKSFAAFASG